MDSGVSKTYIISAPLGKGMGSIDKNQPVNEFSSISKRRSDADPDPIRHTVNTAENLVNTPPSSPKSELPRVVWCDY